MDAPALAFVHVLRRLLLALYVMDSHLKRSFCSSKLETVQFNYSVKFMLNGTEWYPPVYTERNGIVTD